MCKNHVINLQKENEHTTSIKSTAMAYKITLVYPLSLLKSHSVMRK
jgi:hypothetical protein